MYIPFGGLYGDCSNYHGYLIGVSENHSMPTVTYRVPTTQGAGIWAPPGASVSADGYLYATTGNGSSTAGFDGSNAVVRLSADLASAAYFASPDFAQLNRTDTDLGSTGPVLLSNGLIFQIGKAGRGLLFESGMVSGSPTSTGAVGFVPPVFSEQVCGGAYGGDAFVAGAPGQGMVFVPCSDGLVALKVGPGTTFSVAWRDPDVAPGAPIVAGGAVWFMDKDNGSLVALDASTGSVRFTAPVGGVTTFSAPAASAGRLFAVAGGQVIAISGI